MHKDLAWAYDFPTRQLLPITGMVAFYNEKVDTFVDGQLLERPETHFFRTDRVHAETLPLLSRSAAAPPGHRPARG